MRARYRVRSLGINSAAKAELEELDKQLSLVPKLVRARLRIAALQPAGATRFQALSDRLKKMHTDLMSKLGQDTNALATELEALLNSGIKDARSAELIERIGAFKANVEAYDPSLGVPKEVLEDVSEALSEATALAEAGALESATTRYDDARKRYARAVARDLQARLAHRPEAVPVEKWQDVVEEVETLLQGVLHAPDNSSPETMLTSLGDSYTRYLEPALRYQLGEVEKRIESTQEDSLKKAYQNIAVELNVGKEERAKRQWAKASESYRQAVNMYRIAEYIAEKGEWVREEIKKIEEWLINDPDNKQYQSDQTKFQDADGLLEETAEKLADSKVVEAQEVLKTVEARLTDQDAANLYESMEARSVAYQPTGATGEPAANHPGIWVLASLPETVREADSESPADRLRRIDTLIDRYADMQRLVNSAALFVALLVSLASGYFLLYLPEETWGSSEDVILALFWGFGLHTVTNASAFGAFATFAGPQQVLAAFRSPAAEVENVTP